VCEGIHAAARAGSRVSLRVTVQRANYRQLPQFVALARGLGAHQVSFLAVDVANPHAFARQSGFETDLALSVDELPVLAELLDAMEREYAADFRSGLIADSPRKLRRIHQYFAALCGRAAWPPVRCNVFDYSAVIGATGRINPCFFISGPPGQPPKTLGDALNAAPMIALRQQIRSGARPECARCVCSLWRDADSREVADFLPRRHAHA
jgi:Fe-coproporphyrin III synthase